MKAVIFTHGADIDGMGCSILGNIAFGDVETIYAMPFNVDQKFVEFFNIKKTYDDDEEREIYDLYGCDKIRDYDKIFVTDLCLNDELLKRIAYVPIANQRFSNYDHHESAKNNGAGLYLFNDVKVADVRGLCSGTSIFYENLVKKGLIKPTIALNDFVEIVRRQDTWEWKTKYNDTRADDLAQLFNAIGKDNFNRLMIEKLTSAPNVPFEFTEEEQEIVDAYREKIEKACQDCLKSMTYANVGGAIIGVCDIDYKYRNEMAEFLRHLHIAVDVMALPNYKTNACSFRSINEDVDVNDLAVKFDGGGHKAASSAPITPKLEEVLQIKNDDRFKKYKNANEQGGEPINE